MATFKRQCARLRTLRTGPLLIFFALALAVPRARAQSTSGSIRGTVQDISGAAVPGATIAMHSLDANLQLVTTSNAFGEYQFENLKAGSYKLVAHHEGFKDAVVPSVALEKRQQLRVQITLRVPAEVDSLEMTADAGKIGAGDRTAMARLR
jgi:hypothetical protein